MSIQTLPGNLRNRQVFRVWTGAIGNRFLHVPDDVLPHVATVQYSLPKPDVSPQRILVQGLTDELPANPVIKFSNRLFDIIFAHLGVNRLSKDFVRLTLLAHYQIRGVPVRASKVGPYF